MRAYKGLLVFISILSLQFTTNAEEGVEDKKVYIAVVGGTTFGDPTAFGKGLVEEEGVFTIETKKGKSPPI